jgi:hypothetical protein
MAEFHVPAGLFHASSHAPFHTIEMLSPNAGMNHFSIIKNSSPFSRSFYVIYIHIEAAKTEFSM